MVKGALPTIFVADMDRAVDFYTRILGMKLKERFGNHWASIDTGDGRTIGLHPASEQSPAKLKGSITIGMEVTEPIEQVVARLKSLGVKFTSPIVDDKAGFFASFDDAEGNPLYLYQLKSMTYSPESEKAHA